jgi:hypothetical protein
MSVEPPDCAALEQKALHLLTDAEKVQIIHLRKSEHSLDHRQLDTQAADVNLPQFR